MTAPTQENQAQVQEKPSDKELNFRALQAKYERQLEEERTARLEAERIAKEAISRKEIESDDEVSDSEPYVDHKKLNKTLNKHAQSTQSEIQKAMQMAKQAAKDELKQEIWLEQNPDFHDTLKHAEKIYQKSPRMAETILRMPDGFERQKLVYESIKAMGLDKPEQKQSTIQEKVDANRKGPYYQPSSNGAPPYAQAGDFSNAGQKNAYAKMQELKNRLRLG
jgi:hypothetical protein